MDVLTLLDYLIRGLSLGSVYAIIAIIPIIILYMTCQKYIIEGVVAGAVKG